MTDELDAELAAWAESDAPVTVPGRILRGAAARAAGRRALDKSLGVGCGSSFWAARCHVRISVYSG